MSTEQPTVCGPERLELGEGARWVDGRLVLTDILTGRLLEVVDEAAPLRLLAALKQPLGAAAAVAGRPGHWITAVGTGLALLDPRGALRWLGRPEQHDGPPARMNDGCADPAGRFWAGSMAYDGTPGAGSLYRVDHDLTVTRVLDGITTTNGPAFTPDGTALYLADTDRGHLDRHDVDPVTGALGPAVPFRRFAPGEGSPDGMTVDQQGNLWVALWGGGAVHRYRPDGTLDRVVQLPAAQPTSVCLGGPDGRRMYITSARTGLGASAGPADGALFALDADIPGLPAAYFTPADGSVSAPVASPPPAG